MSAPQESGDTSVAVAFLQGYLPSGPWTIVHDLEADGAPRRRWPVIQFFPGQEAQLADAIEANQGCNNIYFVVNLPTPTAALRTSPSEEEISAYLSVPLDVDLPADATQQDFDDVVESIRAVTPPVTAVTFSGGGIQAFWLFADPQPLTRSHDYERAVLYFAERFGGDHVQNLNRLMRLPGTVNVLNDRKRAAGRTPRASYVIEADWQRRITLDATIDAPRSPNARFSVAELAEPWRERITSGSTDWLRGNDKTNSAAVFGISCQLVRVGWTDDAIASVLTDEAYGISRHVLDQPRPAEYARKQARDARARVARDFIRNDKGAIIADNYENVKKGFIALGTTLSYDSFADRILYINGDDRPTTFGDSELKTYRIRRFAEELKFRPSKDYFADAVSTVAFERGFHPVIDYLTPLSWDQTPRINTWLIDFAGAPDTAYTRAVSRLVLIAAVCRVRSPGCKFDEMLVFESPQGKDKSTALHILAVQEDWFADSLTLNASGKEVIEQLIGKWIVEAADLSGMRKSDIETLKAFLSRQSDRARLAYGRFPVERPRSCVFFGTTNSTRYLRDEENRRFWPVKVSSFNIPALAAVRDQLWAEAAAAHAAGEPIRLAPNLYVEAASEQRLRRVEDPWVELFENAFGSQTGRTLTTDIWRIIDRAEGQRTQEDNRRVGEAMRELGWERIRTSSPDGMKWFYARGTPAERKRDLYILRAAHHTETEVVDSAELDRRGIRQPSEENPF
jgi:hypothetical protein